MTSLSAFDWKEADGRSVKTKNDSPENGYKVAFFAALWPAKFEHTDFYNFIYWHPIIDQYCMAAMKRWNVSFSFSLSSVDGLCGTVLAPWQCKSTGRIFGSDIDKFYQIKKRILMAGQRGLNTEFSLLDCPLGRISNETQECSKFDRSADKPSSMLIENKLWNGL